MTKQNVEVNVNMVNVEGVSGVNKKSSETSIRVLKPTHERAKLFKLMFGYKTMDEMINELFDMKLEHSDEAIQLKYKLLQPTSLGGNDK